MFCHNCGTQIPEKGKFCPGCGTPVAFTPPPPLPPEPEFTPEPLSPPTPEPVPGPVESSPESWPELEPSPPPTLSPELEFTPEQPPPPPWGQVPVSITDADSTADVPLGQMPVFAADSEPTADADLAANADSTTDAESGPEDIPVAVTEDDVATDAELDSLPEPTPAPVLVFDPASESADTTTPEQETMPPATAYQPAAPVPYAPDQYPAPTIIASNKPRKQKKTLFIVLGVILLLVLLVVGGFVGFNIYRSNVYDEALTAFNAQRYQQAYDSLKDLGDYRDAPALMARAQQGIDYEDARVLLDAEDYEGALRAFSALGDYQDAAAMARFCQNTLDFRSAVSDFEAGSYETAREAFSALAAAGFSDAEEWQDKTDYALAELKYDAGDYYGAYKDFEALGSYEDAAERMQQCTTAYPGTGELYHNDAYVSSASSIGIDGTNASYASYYKIYSGSELVSTIFLNAGGECTVDVPPGSYTIKEATGEAWFGEEIMFGDAGHYEVMLFDDGNEYFDLASNIEATITLSVIDGDIGSLPTDREDF